VEGREQVSRVLVFRPHQQTIYDALLDAEYRSESRRWGLNIWSGMGSGKTSVVLTYLDALYRLWGESEPTIILAPLRVAQSTWPDELSEWSHLSGLLMSPIVGTKEERIAALKRDVPIYTINYDNIVWLCDYLEGRWPFRTVVPDEATRLKNFRLTQGGVRSSRLGAIAHTHVRRWINVTGTPAPNGYTDLWGQQYFIDKGRRLGLSHTGFEDRWFAWKRREGDTHGKDRILLPGSEEHIQDVLRDCTVTITNALGVDEPVFNTIKVELPKAAMRKYRELEREMYATFNEKGVEVFNAAGLTMKCLQVANGAVYPTAEGDEPVGPFIEVHDAKIEALRSVVEEGAGMPVLVAYNFKSDLARLLRAFPNGRHLDADPATIREWNAGRIPVLFAHPASAGHGLNLQHGSNILTFFGLWWDLELHQQIIERLGPTRQKQSGYDRPVFVHYLVAKGTVDELVLKRLKSKASVQQILLEALRNNSG
jgi:SNF2 family DNA or RNA helicase